MARRYRSLAAWMRATHTTPAKLARELGVTTAYVSMLKNKRRQPTLEMGLKLHRLTGVPLENFLIEELDPLEQSA